VKYISIPNLIKFHPFVLLLKQKGTAATADTTSPTFVYFVHIFYNILQGNEQDSLCSCLSTKYLGVRSARDG
jgi:hypothetical protein